MSGLCRVELSKLPFRELAEAEIGTLSMSGSELRRVEGGGRGWGAAAEVGVRGYGAGVEHTADATAVTGLPGWWWQGPDPQGAG